MDRFITTSCAALLSATALFAHTPEDDFYHAYYLAHETEQLAQALELFRSVAAAEDASDALRADAQHFAEVVSEDLAARDFTRLFPAGTLAYAEIEEPGGRIGKVLDLLGLLQNGRANERLGISPLLLESLLGVDGAAIGLTGINMMGGGAPKSVAVLHPGDMDFIRGLVETMVPAQGRAIEPIADRDSWELEGLLYVTLSHRLAIVSPDKRQIEGVLDRLDGRKQKSLATNELLADTLALRGDDLLFFCLNTSPIAPIAQGVATMQAKDHPRVATAIKLADIGSLRAIAGRVGLNGDGLGLDLNVQMKEGHKSVVFNLLRSAPLDGRAFESIPEGAAFLASVGVNGSGVMQVGLRDEAGDPIVTLMDVGRELFANIIDISVFGMAPLHGTPETSVPEIGYVVRVNDPARSRELWNLGLTIASLFEPHGEHSLTAEQIAGHEGFDVERYQISGQPLYFVADGNDMIITSNEFALARTLEGRRYGRSILDDGSFAPNLEHLADGKTSTFVVSPRRLAKMAQHLSPEGAPEGLELVAQLAQDSVFSVSTRHSNTNLGVGLRLHHVPDVSPLVVKWMDERWPERDKFARRLAQRAATPVQPLGTDGVLYQFHATDPAQVDQRRDLALRWSEEAQDADKLDGLARQLLKSSGDADAFDDVIVQLAERANELGEYGNWEHLDTLAHAQYGVGAVAEAIAIQERAVELAQADGKSGALSGALAKFRAAAH